MSTKTRIETTVVDQRHATSAILFGGESNPHYADERSRQIVTRVERNVHGEYVGTVGTGRTVDYAGNATELFGVESYRTSPIFTTVDDAREWVCAAGSWALHNLTSKYAGGTTPSFPIASESHTYCGGCGRWDTITTSLEAWADVYTCSACGDSSRRSIGD